MGIKENRIRTENWISENDFGFVNVEKWLLKEREDPKRIEDGIRIIENQLKKDYASIFWLREGMKQIMNVINSMDEEIRIRKAIIEMEKEKQVMSNEKRI